jgi:antitoxin component YwqK of YwqJK toxin-antitoxin module
MKTNRIVKLIFLVISQFVIENISAQNIINANGQKQGKWEFPIQYDSVLELSDITIECFYLNDTLQGLYRILDMNKTLRYEMQLLNGKRNGMARAYDRKRRLVWVTNYFNDTIRSEISFSRAGCIVRISEFNNKEKHGIQQKFGSKGRPRTRQQFNNGIMIHQVYYFKSGKISHESFYDNLGYMLKATYYSRSGKVKSGWIRN